MKLRIISTFVVTTALGAWAAACGVTQPPTQCITGHGGYAALYTLKPGQPTGACAERHGEVIGIQKYAAPASASNPDPTQTIAIKTATLTGLSEGVHEGAADIDIISLGNLASGLPDPATKFCTAAAFDVNRGGSVHDVAGGTDIAYAWSNVKFYTTAQVPGTQMIGDLNYTEGGCTASYSVTAVFPAVSCDNGHGEPDVSLCCFSNEDGLALNPDFPVRCEPNTLLCVLDTAQSNGTIPAVGGSNSLKRLCNPTAQ
jgi:hypothetical protein